MNNNKHTITILFLEYHQTTLLQCNLRIKDTLGTGLLSFIQRLSSGGRFAISSLRYTQNYLQNVYWSISCIVCIAVCLVKGVWLTVTSVALYPGSNSLDTRLWTLEMLTLQAQALHRKIQETSSLLGSERTGQCVQLQEYLSIYAYSVSKKIR